MTWDLKDDDTLPRPPERQDAVRACGQRHDDDADGAVKSLPEAEGVDSFLPYWQYKDLVLIGEDHPPQYLEFVRARGGEGQIYMNAIRRFSKKKLNFM